MSWAVMVTMAAAAMLVWARAATPAWIFGRSVIAWEAPADPNRAAWNLVLTTPAITNLPNSELLRSSAPTNGIAKWLIVLDGTTNRLSAALLLADGPPSGNYVVWCSARDRDGNFSDWAKREVFIGATPTNLTLK